MKNKLILYDTTLRDGEQSPGFAMTVDDKVKLAGQLIKLGVDVIEAGFPVSHRDDFNAIERIADLSGATRVSALARAVESDIMTAWESLRNALNPRIHIFIPTSGVQIKHILGKDEKEIIKQAVDSVCMAASLCSDVQFSAMDAVRTNRDYLLEVFMNVIEAGASTINISDTVGYCLPDEMHELICHIKKNLPACKNVTLSVHCHNDLGLAVANSLSAVSAGVLQVEGTINGIGERAGNASLEEIIMAVKIRSDRINVVTDADTRQIAATSAMLSGITGIPVQPNKAIVGSNAFSHGAGIHQDGILKKPDTYEIMNPSDVGVDGSTFVMGRHSGSHALSWKLESMGFHLSGKEMNDYFKKFKKLSVMKKIVTDEDLIRIL